MKWQIAILSVLLMSGCICCGGLSLDSITGKKTSSEDEGGGVSCTSPYIQVGTECCLDDDSNGICDSEETVYEDDQSQGETTPTTIEEDSVDEVTTTTQLESTETTIQQVTITTISSVKSSSYACVREAGYDPDKVIFVYSQRCGSGFVSDASMASIKTGIDIQPVNIGDYATDEKKLKLQECFYGTYSSTNQEFGSCPRLFCPKNGKYYTLTGKGSLSVSSQMTGFAKSCV